MANSKAKAQDLKNSYVSGIIDQLKTEGAPLNLQETASKMGAEQGQTSSVLIDLKSGKARHINDGEFRVRINGPRGIIDSEYVGSNRTDDVVGGFMNPRYVRYPIDGKPGEKEKFDLPPQQQVKFLENYHKSDGIVDDPFSSFFFWRDFNF